jgi:hypothetical protein
MRAMGALVTNRHPHPYWRCILRVALCYVFAIQAFLSAFETTIAAARAPASDTWLVICHGVDSTLPSSGGAGNPEKLPCVLCAVAAAALGLLPHPVPPAVAQLSSARSAGFTHAVAIVHQPPSRAGSSRAPPSFA